MRWNPGGRSKNLEDMRGASAGGGGFGGGGGRRLGFGGLVVLSVLSVVFKKDLVTGALTGDGAPGAAVSAPGRLPFSRCVSPRGSSSKASHEMTFWRASQNAITVAGSSAATVAEIRENKPKAPL